MGTATSATGGSATSQASELSGSRWQSRPWTARAIKVAVVALPILASVIATRFYTAQIPRPPGLGNQVVFWGGAFAVSVLAMVGTDRLTRRMAPLAMLFNVSLVFPDEAPSRFSMALRNGSSKQLAARLQAGEHVAPADAAETLLRMISDVSHHDRLTRGHSERVRAFTEMLSEEMGLPEGERDRLRWAALIHDIGKLTVPTEILNKAGRPTEDEWKVLRNHPLAAERMVESLRPWLGDAVLAASQHHERWDGNGYPHGLKAEEISSAGRIVAVADAYDVMTAARSYKAPLPASAAREELTRNAGTQFDPAVVRAMLAIGLGRLRLAMGPLGWLSEIAWLARVPQAASGAVATTGSAVVVGVGSVIAAPVPAEPAEPVEAAVERIVDVVEVENLDSPSTTVIAVVAGSETEALPAEPSTTTTGVPGDATSSTTSTTSIPGSVASSTTTTTTTSSPTSSTSSPGPGTTTTTAAPPTVPTTTTPPTSSTTTTTTTSTTTTTTTTTTTAPPAPPSPPGAPTGSGFDYLTIPELPASLANDGLTAGDKVFVWRENDGFTLASPLTVRSFVPGVEMTGASTATTTLPIGTNVCSFMVHADPDAFGQNFSPSIDFGVAVLGFALTDDDLNASSSFAVPGIDYAYDGLNMRDKVTATGSTIDLFYEYAILQRDQLRVFVQC